MACAHSRSHMVRRRGSVRRSVAGDDMVVGRTPTRTLGAEVCGTSRCHRSSVSACAAAKSGSPRPGRSGPQCHALGLRRFRARDDVRLAPGFAMSPVPAQSPPLANDEPATVSAVRRRPRSTGASCACGPITGAGWLEVCHAVRGARRVSARCTEVSWAGWA